VFINQIFKEISSVGTFTERNVPFSHHTREVLLSNISGEDEGVEIRIEMSSGHGEMFISVLEMDKE